MFLITRSARRRRTSLPLLFICSYGFITTANFAHASTTLPSSSNAATNTRHVLQEGLSDRLKSRWERARVLATLEQAVEDRNAEIVAIAPNEVAALSERTCIALPLDDKLFDPPPGVFSHGHVQTGDKMSLPRNFWTSITKSHAEVPWLFEVTKLSSDDCPSITSRAVNAEPNLKSVVGGAIDFRAPPNHVFLPRWMMHALRLKPLDVVVVRAKRDTPPGASVRLRPHAAAFLKIRNHRAVLETELKHYSALVKGSTIPFDYLGERHYFDVVDLRSAPRNEKVPVVKVQDCDLVAEFVRSREDVKRMKEERERKLKENIQED